MRYLIIIGAFVIIGLSAWYMGFIPGAEVVGGIEAPVRLQPIGYDPVYGAEFTVKESRGVYKNYEKDWVGAYISPTRYKFGFTKDTCLKMGGIWEYESECFIPSNAIDRIGDDVKITKSTISLCCGWCPNSFLSNCGADFGKRYQEDIILKPNGYWFEGIVEDMDTFDANQREAALKNCECDSGGSIWVKEIECMPEWQCSAWSSCYEGGTRLRSCTDINDCGLEKPSETEICEYEGPDEIKSPFEAFFAFLNNIFTGIGNFFANLLIS